MTDSLLTELTEALTSIRDDWDAPLASLRAVRSGIGGRPSAGIHPPAPISIGLSDARLDTAVSLFGWCAILVEERDLQHVTVSQHDVVGMCDLLLRHVDWWAEHEAAWDMAYEVAERAAHLHAMVAPDRRVTVCIGRCPLVDDEGEPCTGTVRADPETGRGTCDTCQADEHVDWWRERIAVEEYVTIRELARIMIYQGYPTTEKAVRRAIESGRLQVVAKDARGRRLLSRAESIPILSARRRAA